MNVDTYLQRIRYDGTREPTVATLRKLHRAHLFAVPFENLDIHLGRPITLSLPAFYDKIVQHQRGGFCYELNGLFSCLLEQLGFTVRLLSAQVFQDEQRGPEFDHLLLLVDMETPWIADVGFGDLFLEPLPLTLEQETPQNGSTFRFVRSSTGYILQRRRNADWESEYAFSLAPRQLADFQEMCRYQQTSPESHFTQKTVCSLATPTGRITLSNHRLITTKSGQREEREVKNEAEYRGILKHSFGMDLQENTKLTGKEKFAF